jgi:tetratricopeptide (TPR) repeat protein
LDVRLELPEVAVEALLSELRLDEMHPESWERLHAAAVRDDKEFELEVVYGNITVERRLKQLTEYQRTSLLLHAADFCQGILGNADAAEGYLWRILEAVPDHADAFDRLERRLSASRENMRLVELYALVAAKPSRPPGELATAVVNIISQFPSQLPVSDETCRKLLVLLPESPTLLSVLEGHCRNTGRAPLACSLLEESLVRFPGTQAEMLERQRQLIKLYLGDANAPEKAILHLEALLVQDPSDTQARAAAERLLRSPQVASRAAAALQEARRNARERG